MNQQLTFSWTFVRVRILTFSKGRYYDIVKKKELSIETQLHYANYSCIPNTWFHEKEPGLITNARGVGVNSDTWSAKVNIPANWNHHRSIRNKSTLEMKSFYINCNFTIVKRRIQSRCVLNTLADHYCFILFKAFISLQRRTTRAKWEILEINYLLQYLIFSTFCVISFYFPLGLSLWFLS